MVNRMKATSGWRAIAVAFVALAILASPVMADQGKARGRNSKPAAHRYQQVKKQQVKKQQSKHDRQVGRTDRNVGRHDRNVGRHDRNIGRHDRNVGRHDRHTTYVRPVPRYVRHDRQVYHHYPVWSPRPYRVHYYDENPFYFHSGFNVFFGGDAFSVNIGSFPPPGYAYFDPYCDVTFVSVTAFRRHIHRHHHPALIRVIAVDDYACGSHYGDYDDGYYYDD